MAICSGNSGTVAVEFGDVFGDGLGVGVDCRGVDEGENVGSEATAVISG